MTDCEIGGHLWRFWTPWALMGDGIQFRRECCCCDTVEFSQIPVFDDHDARVQAEIDRNAKICKARGPQRRRFYDELFW